MGNGEPVKVTEQRRATGRTVSLDTESSNRWTGDGGEETLVSQEEGVSVPARQ